MEKLNKICTILVLAVLINTGIFAQSIPTLELTRLATPVNSGFGTSILPMTATFQNDAVNDNNFAANAPAITVTATLQNQTFTGLSYGTGSTAQTTGLVFGAGPTVGGSSTLGAAARNRWDIIGAYTGSFGPTDAMFTSNPTATGAQLGTGITVSSVLANTNGAFEIFTTAYELYKQNIPITQRVLFGQLKLTFSQPVKNPIVDFVGLGGSFRYSVIGLPVNDPNSWRSTYFSTELELQTPGLTSIKMSGNQFFSVTGNNILNNNNVNPNGASVNDPGLNTPPSFNDFGAATGSVRINGTVQELIYNIYLEGGTGSQFAWGVDKSNILGATTDPFAGDIWYVSASLDKPTQQIFGNVFIDPQTSDNNINQSFGNPNTRTNAGGLLFANLISGGVVVATVPVSANGDYLFDNVAPGTYTVQLSSNQGVVGQPQPATALPLNWINTGEFIGSGAGTDGSVNGISASFNVNASDIVTNVNFGIKAGACPNNVLYQNPIAFTGYFGGFEVTPAASNFYPTGVNYSNGRGRIYPATPLAAADYSITANPNLFNNTLSSYLALGGQNQMAVKPSATNQTAYYIIDSAGKTNSGFQIWFISGPGPGGDYNFRGWFSKSTAADAVIKIKIYDADVTSRVFKDMNVTVTGAAGSWVYWTAPWNVNYGVPGTFSLTKKVKFDVISVNGAPFSIDELCFDEPALGPPLPITLSYFTVNKTDCSANLVWKTETESNSDRFEVEVSTSANPVYTIAGTVSASGSSSTTKTYQFGYPMKAGVVYYFRIKMIDKDGSFTYSDYRSSSCTKGRGDIVIVPNPVKTTFNISGMESGKNSILVYGANGQLVKTQTIAQSSGDVNISYLAPGMYMVKVTSETGNTVVSKLIKY